MDTFTKKERSRIMARIKGKHTKPEILARKLLHTLGYRYSLHKHSLPGSPDIYLKKYKTVIFVHGCFWHRHRNCRYAKKPKASKRLWNDKFKANIKRDRRKLYKLKKMGYKTMIIWECEIASKNIVILKKKIMKILPKHR